MVNKKEKIISASAGITRNDFPKSEVIEEVSRLRSEFRERVATYIIAGLGVVVGFAWNEAIKALIDHFWPLSSVNGVFAKFLYAGVLTSIVVLITMYVVRPPVKK